MPHGEDEHRHAERYADPKAAGHIVQLGVLLFPARYNVFRLQRHAANGAVAGMILLDLRVHRACVNGLCRLAESWVPLQTHAAFRTTSRLVAFHAIAHRAEVFLFGRRRNRHCAVRDGVLMIALHDQSAFLRA